MEFFFYDILFSFIFRSGREKKCTIYWCAQLLKRAHYVKDPSEHICFSCATQLTVQHKLFLWKNDLKMSQLEWAVSQITTDQLCSLHGAFFCSTKFP